MITPIDTTTAGSVTGGTVLAKIPDKTATVVSTPEITATGGKSPLKDTDKNSASGEVEKRLGKQGVSKTSPAKVEAKADKAANEAKQKADKEEQRRAEKERKRREVLEALRKRRDIDETILRKEREKEKPGRLVQLEKKKSPTSDPDAWLKDIHPIQVK